MSNPIIYTNSPYTSGIWELEAIADFIRDYAREFYPRTVPVDFLDEILGAIRGRADRLRQHEDQDAGGAR